MLSRDQFEGQYTENSEAIFRFLYWQTKDLVLSQDLAASTFERAWKSRTSFTGGSFKAWLYRIARNLLTDHWRKSKTLLLDDMPGLADHIEGPPLAYDYDSELAELKLQQALLKLPNRLRMVVALRFIEGLPAREVAQILGTTEGNVRVLQYRALAQLKHLMSDHEIR